jgi:hypothetical protein
MNNWIRTSGFAGAVLGVASLVTSTGLAGDGLDAVDPNSPHRKAYLDGGKATVSNESTLEAIRQLRGRIDELDRKIKAATSECQSTVTTSELATPQVPAQTQTRIVRRIVGVVPTLSSSAIRMNSGLTDFRPQMTGSTLVPMTFSGRPLFYQLGANSTSTVFNVQAPTVLSTPVVVQSPSPVPSTVQYFRVQNAPLDSRVVTNCIAR